MLHLLFWVKLLQVLGLFTLIFQGESLQIVERACAVAQTAGFFSCPGCEDSVLSGFSGNEVIHLFGGFPVYIV